MRQYQRNRRTKALTECGVGIETETVNPELIVSPDLGEPSGVRLVLNEAARRVLQDESLDSAIVARSVASLASVALKLIEQTDFVERLETLESRIQEQERNKQ
jgi:hypothetical protein